MFWSKSYSIFSRAGLHAQWIVLAEILILHKNCCIKLWLNFQNVHKKQWIAVTPAFFFWDWIFKMYLFYNSMTGLSVFLSMSWSLSLWVSLRDGDYKWMCAACVMPINEESLRPVWTQREERAVVPSPYISILNSLESPPLSVALPQTLIGRLTHSWLTPEQTWPGAQPFQIPEKACVEERLRSAGCVAVCCPVTLQCCQTWMNPISLSYPFPFVLPLALVPRTRVVSARGENIPLWNETTLGYCNVIILHR